MNDALTTLKEASDQARDRLLTLITDHGLAEESLGSAYHDRRGADVVTHLHAWLVLLSGWLAEDAAGGNPALPLPGRTWDELDAINDELYEQYRHLSWDEALAALAKSESDAYTALSAVSEERLLDRQGASWVDDPLIALAEECLAKHYEWGIATVTRAVESQ